MIDFIQVFLNRVTKDLGFLIFYISLLLCTIALVIVVTRKEKKLKKEMDDKSGV